jgi:hypothetical protein
VLQISAFCSVDTPGFNAPTLLQVPRRRQFRPQVPDASAAHGTESAVARNSIFLLPAAPVVLHAGTAAASLASHGNKNAGFDASTSTRCRLTGRHLPTRVPLGTSLGVQTQRMTYPAHDLKRSHTIARTDESLRIREAAASDACAPLVSTYLSPGSQ